MPEAARLGDPIGHSPTMAMLIGGPILGAAVAAAVVGTGGLAAVAIIGATAAAGAGIAEVVSTMSFIPKQRAGQIITGSDNVYINGQKAARAHIDTADCDKHTPPRLLASGSGNVYINGFPAARVGDKLDCSAEIMEGARGVFIGGGTQQTDMIQPENLVPDWVHASLLIVGVGGVGLVAGWAVALGGLALSVLGDMTGDWAGGEVFGEGSDGQKASMLSGSLIGGYLGAKAGPKTWDFVKRIEIKPGTLGMSGGNLRLRPEPLETTELDPHYQGEEIPNNPNSWTRGWGTVRYLSDSEKAAYKLTVKDGKLYDSEGRPFDTSNSSTWDGENKAIYVMDENGNIYASQEQKVFDFHHSSLGQGKPVAGAGEIEVNDGLLQSINNRSGHYKPSEDLLTQTVKELKRQGVDFSEATVDTGD